MSKLLGFILVFISSLSLAEEAPVCSTEAQPPTIRLNVAKSKLDDRLRDVFASARPKIQHDLRQLLVKDFVIKARPGSEECDGGRLRPGYDRSTNCLYVIASLVDYEMAGVTVEDTYNQYRRNDVSYFSSVGDSLAFSIPSRIGFTEMKINDFSLGEFDLQCYWNEASQYCEIKVQVRRFELETLMELRSPDDNRLLLRTVQPQQVVLEPPPSEPVFIRFKAQIFLDKVGEGAIVIDRSSFDADIPEGLFKTPRHNEFADINKSLMVYAIDQTYRNYFLGSDFPINGSSDQQVEYIQANSSRIVDENALIESAIERFKLDFAKIDYLRKLSESFDADPLRVWGNELWRTIQPGLSQKLTKVMESKIPFSKELVTYLPIRKMNDLVWEKKYKNEISEQVMAIHESAAQLREAQSWKDISKEFKVFKKLSGKRKILKTLKYVGDSSSGPIKANLRMLSSTLEFYDHHLTSIGEKERFYGDGPEGRREKRNFEKRKRIFVEIKRQLNETQQIVQDTITQISANIKAEEKELKIKIFRVAQAEDPDMVEFQFSSCLPKIKVQPESISFDRPVPRPDLQDHEFSFQIPVALMNEYLKVLHAEDYFSTCIGMFGIDCKAFNEKFLLKWIVPKKSREALTVPHIVQNEEGQFVLRVNKFKFTESKLPIIGSGRAHLDIDLNQVLEPGGVLFDDDSVNASVNPLPDLGVENIPSMVMNEDSIHMIQAMNVVEFVKGMWVSLALHTAKFVLHTGTIESLESRGILSQIVNCGVEAIPLFKIKQIKASDDNFITFYGDFKDKVDVAEPQGESTEPVCSHSYL